MTRKVRILDVAYNASNNELVRTQTLVKGAIIQVDAAPFKQWYQQHYGVEVGVKKRGGAAAAAADAEEATAAQSNHVKRKLKQRNQGRKLDQLLDDQFATGRLYAAISSRPGQVRVCALGGCGIAVYCAKWADRSSNGGGSILCRCPFLQLSFTFTCCASSPTHHSCSAAARTAMSWRAASSSST